MEKALGRVGSKNQAIFLSKAVCSVFAATASDRLLENKFSKALTSKIKMSVYSQKVRFRAFFLPRTPSAIKQKSIDFFFHSLLWGIRKSAGLGKERGWESEKVLQSNGIKEVIILWKNTFLLK